MNNLIGCQLGKYKLTELLGRGGMAEVYQAHQPTLERFVAIKVLRGYAAESAESLARFKREGKSIAQLRHPHIVQVYDFDVEGDLYYMVMEYIQGGTLSRHLRQHGALPAREALRLTLQLADALQYAHQAGVIHRDIKPANVMFADLQQQQAVLTDFGIARILSDPTLTAEGRPLGTPAYLSPEAIQYGVADERSDIYSLGLTLYEMLTGQIPFSADTTRSMVMQHIATPLPSARQFNASLPKSLELTLYKAAAKSRERRYQSVAEFKAALQTVYDELSDQAASEAEKDTPHLLPGLPVAPRPAAHANGNGRTRTIALEAASGEGEAEGRERPARRRRPLWLALVAALLASFFLIVPSVNSPAIVGSLMPTQPPPAALFTATSSLPLLPSATWTWTPTATFTLTPTNTATATKTPTAILTETPSPTLGRLERTLESQKQDIPTKTASPTPTATQTPFPSATATFRPTARPTNPPPSPVPPTAAPTNTPSDGGGGGAVNTMTVPITEVLPPVLQPTAILPLPGLGG